MAERRLANLGALGHSFRLLGLLGAAIALVLGTQGCGHSDWVVVAQNGVPKPYVVRITTASASWSWVVRGPSGETLLRRSAPLSGRVEVIDPDTCAVIGSTPVLERSFVVGIDPGPSATLDVWAEEPPTDLPAREPDFKGCLP